MGRARKEVFLTDYDTRAMLCPSCGSVRNRATRVGGPGEEGPPSPGALIICMNCATIRAFTAAGFRLATNEERKTVIKDEVHREIYRRALLDAATRTGRH